MKTIKKLFIYKFCTLGGVEKCLLDRATLYKNNLAMTCYVCFLYAEKSVLATFQHYIALFNLEQTLQVIAFDEIKQHQFDMVSIIDTTDAFDMFDKMNIECHTGYTINQKYLKKLPSSVDKIIVPSQPFADFIAQQYHIDAEKLVVLPNFVIKKQPTTAIKKIWHKQIVFYFGRLDSLKNYHELFSIFQLLSTMNDNFLFCVLSPSIIELKQILSLYKPLRDKVILMSGMGFANVHDFLYLMKLHRGIYVSASKSESFGLASAEALAYGIPVMLTNHPVHRYLVEKRQDYLYTLGNLEEAATKIMHLANHYEHCQPSDHFLTATLPQQHLTQMKQLIANIT